MRAEAVRTFACGIAMMALACTSPPATRSMPEETGGSGGEPGATGGKSGATGGKSGGTATGGAPGTGGAEATGGAVGTGGTGQDASAGTPDAGSTEPTPDAATSTGGAGGSADAGSTPQSPLTAGWREMPFKFSIHKPYDLPESARHTFDAATNTHTFWVLKTDKPHDPPPNTTAPRTELRMQNDYTTGLHQFEADFYVVNGTDGPCIMQVFGGSAHATAFMLKAYGGTLKHYDRETVKTDAYDKWMHLNVIHNADTGEVKAYIDNQLVGTFKDNGPATHYFKCGVYGPNSARVESRFRNIKYWVK